MNFLTGQEKKISIYFILFILIFFYFDFSIANFFNHTNHQTKSLFTTLTQFGDSLYYFVPLILIWVFIKLLKTRNKNLNTLSDICLFLFWNILISGLFTQILKHIIGRPRPTMLFEFNYNSLDFFNFESKFHSFPSGHSTTVFAVAFALFYLFPRLKNLWLIFAIVIALTRVIITEHFMSDIIAGAFIAYLVSIYLRKKFLVKGLLFIQESNFIKANNEVLKISNQIRKIYLNIFAIYLNLNFYWRYLIIILLLSILFFIFPNIDITFSGFFFTNQNEFMVSENTWFVYFVRKLILPMLSLLAFFVPIAALIKHIIYNEKIINICLRDWVYFFSCLILGTGVVVNLIFKNFWGRARPNDTILFGGDQPFSIPWLNVDYCNTNCSFVSGDVSFFTLSLALLIILNKTKWNLFAYIIIFVISLLRIMEGDHFLSDTIMSFCITFLIIKLLHDLFKLFPKDLNLGKYFKSKA